ncbi:hypothetical protein ACLOJK_006412, partial [Asimina triloba]
MEEDTPAELNGQQQNRNINTSSLQQRHLPPWQLANVIAAGVETYSHINRHPSRLTRLKQQQATQTSKIQAGNRAGNMTGNKQP